jgi:prevent-host-death family protein
VSNVSATEARARLFRLVDEVAESHEPVLITGRRNNAVLIGEDDWRAVVETLHLVRVPGLADSIKAAMTTAPEEMTDDPGFDGETAS